MVTVFVLRMVGMNSAHWPEMKIDVVFWVLVPVKSWIVPILRKEKRWKFTGDVNSRNKH